MAISRRDEMASSLSVQMNVRGADDLGPIRDVSLEHLRELLGGCRQRLCPLFCEEFLHGIGIEECIDVGVDFPCDRGIDLCRSENAPPRADVEAGISALRDGRYLGSGI